jgi:hypothetical protein
MQEFTEEHGDFIPDYEVKVHHDVIRDRLLIFVRMGHFKDGWTLYQGRNAEGLPTYDATAPQTEPPLYLSLGMAEAEAIVRVLAPPPDASARHLDDTIMVRDRLLVLVEKSLG